MEKAKAIKAVIYARTSGDDNDLESLKAKRGANPNGEPKANPSQSKSRPVKNGARNWGTI